ncbi:MAG: hypothetical protein AAB665_02300 [Patescibacteria group bacterium]
MKESVSIPEEDVRRKAKEDTADVSRRTLLKFAAGAAINTLLPKAAMDSRTHAEAVLSPEETIATTERLTGMPYAEFSEHFDARVRVPSPRGGPYVIHIRQMHQPAQDPERKIQGQSDVVARQRETENLIESVVRANKLDGIFSEGFVEKDAALRYRDEVRLLRGQLAGFEKRSIRTTDDAENVYAEFERAYKASLNNPIFYHYTMRDLRTLAHTLRKRCAALAPQSAAERTRLAAFDSKLGAYGVERTDLEIPEPYTAGADFKLLMDGKLKNIYSTEDRAANERAVKATRAYSQALKDFAGGRIRREEIDTYDHAYKKSLEERERILFGRVEEHARERAAAGKPAENIAILFGGRHDFTDMVREQNQTRGRAGRGLIELWPKKLPRGSSLL